MRAVYQLVLAFLVFQRLFELRLSKRNQDRMTREGFSQAGEGLDYRLMVCVHVVWFLGLLIEPSITLQSVHPLVFSVALGFFLVAQLLRVWAISSLSGRWNVNIFSTTASDGVVTSGPYRYIRHPNYLAVILEFLFVPLLGGAYFTAIVGSVLNGVVLARRIPREEAVLFQNEKYRAAFSEKPRFLPSI